LGKGIDGDEDFPIPVVRIGNGIFEVSLGKIQPWKMARIGFVLKTHIDGISAIIHSSLERRQITRWANQFHDVSLFVTNSTF
jgi:hypothetical protein